MNARGSTEVIVATIGLSMGALSQDLFTMIVTMAIVTTLAMPPTLRWALGRLPMRKEEKERLEREEMEAKGFVSQLERLLVAVDDSPNGQFGSRVAGMIAGTRSMPTTVMHITAAKKSDKKQDALKGDLKAELRKEKEKEKEDEKKKTKEDAKSTEEKKADKEAAAVAEAEAKERAEAAADLLKTAAEQMRKRKPKGQQDDKHARRQSHSRPDHGNRAARRGGRERLRPAGDRAGQDDDSRQHRIPSQHHAARLGVRRAADHRRCARRAAQQSAGRQAQHPRAGERHRAVAPRRRSRFRHGAREPRAGHRALRGAARQQRKAARRAWRRHCSRTSWRSARAYGVEAKTAVRSEKLADEAILKEMAKRKHNLIVMGVERRPGEKLFFGETATAILEKSDRSIVFVVS